MVLNTFLRSVLTAAFVLIGQQAVRAQTAPPPSAAMVALAREVVDASGAASSFDNVIPAFVEQAKGMIQQGNPDLVTHLKEISEAIKPEYQKRTNDLVQLIALTYAQKFTEDELRKLLAFYKSPEGTKLVKSMPVILEESFNKSQDWGNTVSREIVARFRLELEKRGIKI